MSLILQLGNSNNWESHYSTSYAADKITVNSHDIYAPILEIVLPITFDKNILAVHVSSSTAKPSWRFAGYASQKIRTGLLVGGAHESLSARRSLWLNEITLLFFDQLASTYTLSINPPKWFRDINIYTWQYTGSATDSTQELLLSIQSVQNEILSQLS